MGVVFLIVDAMNLIRRIYAAAPDDADPQHSEAARNATLQSLRRALRDASPTHSVAVFDGEGPTWRHELYPDYKKGRAAMPQALRIALPEYREAFSGLGVTSVSKPGLEADDVAATLATKASEHGSRTLILSTDKVFCQLVSDHVTVRDHFRQELMDQRYVQQKFGVATERLIDLWALAGMSSTHIPGVSGIGVKTAAKLLEEYDSLERVLDAAETIPGKLGERLRRGRDQARLSYRLSRLRRDLDLGWNLKDFRLRSSH